MGEYGRVRGEPSPAGGSVVNIGEYERTILIEPIEDPEPPLEPKVPEPVPNLEPEPAR